MGYLVCENFGFWNLCVNNRENIKDGIRQFVFIGSFPV
jgi:hypothetical protein